MVRGPGIAPGDSGFEPEMSALASTALARPQGVEPRISGSGPKRQIRWRARYAMSFLSRSRIAVLAASR
jgi:hypothetical protein